MSTKEFNRLQLQEIDRHKWIESEKAGKDLGVGAVLEWIHQHARQFREEYQARQKVISLLTEGKE